ncbi:hypothetical protein [Agathobaculum sp. Marseille-P7918]|uniref:hypothetical protein n=1 Tax=Agathobaculum sp. Marseille-P7918 TaxID=2479843 RepID=UPI00356B3C80
MDFSDSLVLRKTRPERKTKPPAPVMQQTIQQTVIHFHQVNHRHILHRTDALQYLHTETFLLLPRLQHREGREPDDIRSRPAHAAQRLLRLFSFESTKRQLLPFYSNIVHSVLEEEQECYKSRPSQAISLIWNLFGRQQAFRTLTRFYMSAVEKLGTNYYPALHGKNALYLAAGVVLHSQIYRRYVRQLWSGENRHIPMRYAYHEQAITEDVLKLQVARRVVPPREPLAKIVHTQPEARPAQESAPVQELHLSEADFRALVQGVTASLGRQSRLEALRRGGN